MGAAHVMSGSREQHEHIAFFSVVSTSSLGFSLRAWEVVFTGKPRKIHKQFMGQSWVSHD